MLIKNQGDLRAAVCFYSHGGKLLSLKPHSGKGESGYEQWPESAWKGAMNNGREK